MPETQIDSLEVEIQSSAKSAVSGIDALTQSLSSLKKAVGGGLGLRAVANQVSALDASTKNMSSDTPQKISSLANALQKLSGLGSLKLSSSVANQITNLNNSLKGLDTTNLGKISQLVSGLQPLTTLGKSNLGSFISQLNKLPQLSQTLQGMNMSQFTSQIQQLSNALSPLATQLNSVSTSFSRLPSRIRQTVSATNALASSNNIAQKSYVNLYASLRMATTGLQSAARMVAKWINEANQYVESLNLFNASMSRFAQEAQTYAEKISEIMGIDPAEWMRNQGTFNTIIKGFGVVEDKAYTMSQNLTQLGYDISSFFNISVEDAMQKVSSGISGELEPLRRLGYDLSVARLQQDALNLGITKSVSKMTQAEKAQLRYWEMMKQVTTVQGDMARTLEAPANQLRILKAQLIMAARALGNVFIPLLNISLPYVIAFAKAVRMAADALGKLVGFKLPEVDYSGLDTSTTDMFGDIADSTEETADALGEATKKAKELKRTIMGFDELNLLNGNDLSDSLSNVLDALDNGIGSGDLGIELPTYDFLQGALENQSNAIVKDIQDMFSKVGALLVGIGLIVTGLILVAFGHPFLGVSLIVAGVATLYAAEQFQPGIIKQQIYTMFHSVYGIITGMALIVIGLLVMAAGHPLLGIGLIVAGAITVATTAALNPGILSSKIAEILSGVLWYTGSALIVLGVLLLGTGSLPLGVSMIIAGAAMMFTAATLNVTQLNGTISNMFAQVLVWTAIAEIVIGVLLLGFGQMALGITLIVMGAVQMITALVANPSAALNAFGSFFASFGILAGAALVTLGILVTMFGNPGIGMALVIAGLVSTVAAVALNWGTMVQAMGQFFQQMGIIVGGSTLIIGLMLLMVPGANAFGLAMIAMGAATMVAGIVANWSTIVANVKKMLQEIGIVAGSMLIPIGLMVLMTGNLPLGLALIVGGAALLVSGVALNWSSLDAETKRMLTTIGTVSGILAVGLGILLLFTGAGIPLGIALITLGATALITAAALNWGTIVTHIGDFFKAVGRILTGVALVALGVILCGSVGGLPLGIGLIAAGVSAITKPQSFSVENLINIGKQAIAGVQKGVSDAWKGFCSFWEGIWKGIVNWVKNFFGIHSPSTLFESFGLNMVYGLQNGFKNLGSVFTSIFKTMSGWLNGFGKNMFTWGSEMMGNLVKGISSGLNNLANHVARVARTIWSYLHFSEPEIGPLADFNSWMPDMMSQLAQGIANDEDKVKKQVAKLAGDMSLESTIQANVNASGAAPVASTVGDNSSGLISAVYSAVTSALAAGQNEDDDSGIPIIINIGNEQIDSYLVKQNKRAALISGGKA